MDNGPEPEAAALVGGGADAALLSGFADVSLQSEVVAASRVYPAWKRALDIVGSIALALVFSPLVLLIVVRLWLEGGPILFRHERIGVGGRRFHVYKFRTMSPNAQRLLCEMLAKDENIRAEWDQNFKLKNDPRITSLGRFLRRTSLDELPQIWNVVRGEMSLVGPRPIVDEEMPRYGNALRHYLATRPGITGLWQVRGRNDITYQRRVAIDVLYAKNVSLALDLSILVKTVTIVLLGWTGY